MNRFIDTHTHISDEAFRGEEDAVVERAVAAGVDRMILADIDSRERPAMYEAAARHPGVLFPMLGLYPGSVDKNWKQELEALEPWFSRNPVAMGEIGLDYHWSREFRSEQLEALRVQLEMAASRDLPVNIHLRDATEDFLAVARDCAHLHLRGNLHAFSGSAQLLRELRRYGEWSVGIGGVLTFKNAGIAREAAEIPLEQTVLETDAPYLAPTPLRGTRNESANIPLIAAKLAEIKQVSIEEIARATNANAEKLFGLPA
ncbi:MAG: TatD family hydrolase [Bacteroidales bacterium]|nr:TatD family hydrolase [Bacteroidales bacterium]